MIYQIKQVNAPRLTFIALGLIASSLVLVLLNADYKVVPDGFAFILFLLTLIGSIVLSYYWNDGIKNFEIKKNGLLIENKLILWQQIESFKFKNDNPTIETLKIRVKGKTFTISHRTKFKDKDDFRRFYKDFKRAVARENKVREIPIIKEPVVWDTPKGKIYAYVLIMLWVMLTVAVLINFELKTLTYYFVYTGGALPLVFRALKKRKEPEGRVNV